MIRGTRRPGGAGRRSSGRKIRGGGGGKKSGSGWGCVLLIVGSALMLASGLSLIALKLVA